MGRAEDVAEVFHRDRGVFRRGAEGPVKEQFVDAADVPGRPSKQVTSVGIGSGRSA